MNCAEHFTNVLLYSIQFTAKYISAVTITMPVVVPEPMIVNVTFGRDKHDSHDNFNV